MRKITNYVVVLVITILLALTAGCGSKTAGTAAGATTNQNKSQNGKSIIVKFLDIGQGDAILIKTADQVTLVDSGDVPTRDKLVEYIKKEGITAIDNVIITHPHADHIGGMAAVFDKFTVKHVYDSGQETTSQLYKQYLSTIKAKNIPFTVVTSGMKLDLGNGALIKFFGPDKPFITGSNSDLNNNSIVGKLTYENFSVMLTGDAEQPAEEKVISKYASELKSNILKSGHHGSNTASSIPFLKAVASEVAVISCGIDNQYHHPHPSTMKKYADQKIKTYVTANDGTVTVTSDGQSYTINKEK